MAIDDVREAQLYLQEARELLQEGLHGSAGISASVAGVACELANGAAPAVFLQLRCTDM